MSDEQAGNTGQDTWLMRIGRALGGQEPHDRESLVTMLRSAQQRAILDADALSMCEGVLHVAELQVRDVMIPRSKVSLLRRSESVWELLPAIIDSGHSRFPVTGDNRDDVIGILIAKDLLPYLDPQHQREFQLRELLRPALFVPESKRLDALLKLFQESRNHLAIVVDEYGGLAGIVTIEDVIEQIVGEIDDEHDLDDDAWILNRTDDGQTVVKALTPIDAFNEHFRTDFSDEEFDTIGGVVANAFGHVPQRGENLVIEGLRFDVVRADSRRLHLLMVTPDAACAD
ncbi:HlyC/CorC family transporter [Spiribacter vilamensis]|uniref:Magnesium and cobalt efflux protein CorC n=1 Tax=Spiribacter vilamensis TaxID=531306 RepID=A0A4Q8CXX6_9GAMM|nr:transporter associated domain-containing protein [Spiribacter vilamensis]RZU97816.1 magnesium and cobalt transporter [Spiribacter vilamensis]TVO61259.1 CBS domain-containing protein [Spiribacter vilamensis]